MSAINTVGDCGNAVVSNSNVSNFKEFEHRLDHVDLWIKVMNHNFNGQEFHFEDVDQNDPIVQALLNDSKFKDPLSAAIVYRSLVSNETLTLCRKFLFPDEMSEIASFTEYQLPLDDFMRTESSRAKADGNFEDKPVFEVGGYYKDKDGIVFKFAKTLM